MKRLALVVLMAVSLAVGGFGLAHGDASAQGTATAMGCASRCL
jgi:hypothetical protein